MNQLPFLFSPIQIAKILGVSRSKVYALMNSGELKSVHVGRSRRIRKDQMESFISSLQEVA
jgi:excisionase family DNA binding protein